MLTLEKIEKSRRVDAYNVLSATPKRIRCPNENGGKYPSGRNEKEYVQQSQTKWFASKME